MSSNDKSDEYDLESTALDSPDNSDELSMNDYEQGDESPDEQPIQPETLIDSQSSSRLPLTRQLSAEIPIESLEFDDPLQALVDNLEFPENSTLKYLAPDETHKVFSQIHPFSFSALTGGKHTLLLEPNEFPSFTSQVPNHVEDNYTKPGKFPHRFNLEKFRNSQLKQIQEANIKIPDLFFQNSNDYIPEVIQKSSKITDPLIVINENCVNNYIIEISIDDYVFTKKSLHIFYNHLRFYPFLEILSIHRANLEVLPKIQLPHLRIADFVDNDLKSTPEIVLFATKHQSLAILDYRRNPIAQIGTSQRKIIGASISLKFINGNPIKPSDRLKAMNEIGFKPELSETLYFYYCIKAIPEISVLQSWDPRVITHLSLPNSQISRILLQNFDNLVYLNLANNLIKSFSGSSLASCRKLQTIDLSSNQISDKKELKVFMYTERLQNIWLQGNPLPVGYRPYLINITNTLPGSIAQKGLHCIDGIPITIQEIMSNKYHYNKNFDSKQKRDLVWSMEVKRAAGFIKRHNLKVLSLINRQIEITHLEYFSSLTHLILRRNLIEDLSGIESCVHLEVLDISGNPNLNLKTIIQQISDLKELRFFMYAIDCWDPEFNNIVTPHELYSNNSNPLSMRNAKTRKRVLKELLPKLPCLTSLNRSRIWVNERINILKKSNLSHNDLIKYHVHFSWLLSALPTSKIDTSFDKIAPGIQYQPEDVIRMNYLHHSQLTSSPELNFSAFQNLTELDLEHNLLTTVSTLGLNDHPNLKYLDLSHNRIQDSLEVLSELIDSLPCLTAIALRDNPSQESSRDRIQLLRYIRRITDPNDCFKILDSVITPGEISQIIRWPKEINDISNPVEQTIAKDRFLLPLALKVRFDCPLSEVDYSRIEELNLTHSSLTSIDISPFHGLKKLILLKNKISSSSSIIGVQHAPLIEVIDLCYNQFQSIQDLADIIESFPKLINFGCKHNPCMEQKESRAQLLRLLSRTVNPKYPLMAIDDQVITTQEIKNSKQEFNLTETVMAQFSFELAIFRNVRGHILNLSNYGLTDYINFRDLVKRHLRIVSLANNKITTRALLSSSLDQCTDIESLDLSNNKLKKLDASSIGEYLSRLPLLRHLFITGNPLCSKANKWDTFLACYTRLSSLDCQLQTINNYKLTPDDIISSISIQRHSQDEAEKMRPAILLKSIQIPMNSITTITFSNCNLISLNALTELETLQVLDISRNKIVHLAGQGFERLTNLHSLNISDNKIESINEVMSVLCDCPKLINLSMVLCTGNLLTASTPLYINKVCFKLRGLTYLDNFINPYPLKPNQMNALKDIEQITGWNNPNHLDSIDLSNRNINSTDVLSLLFALSILSPKSLNFRGNPCEEMDLFRFLVIYHVPDTEIIDGSDVTVDQRMNADKAVRGTDIGKKDTDDAGMVELEPMDEKDKDESAITRRDNAFTVEFGSALMKWEIFITAEQILVQILSYWPKSMWPTSYTNYSYQYLPFSLDLSFLKYLLDVRIPFWLSYAIFFIYILVPAVVTGIYHLQLDKDYWMETFTTGLLHTIGMTIWFFACCVLCAAGLALISDLNTTYYRHALTNNQISWFTLISGISFILCLAFIIIGGVFKSKSKDPLIWFKVLKLKKRAVLFILTCLYFPIVKCFTGVFSCENGVTKSFNEVKCLDFKNFSGTFQLIHLAALLFGLIYMIGIPIFFIHLINKGTKDIDLSYHFDLMLERLSEKQAEVNRLKKEGKNVAHLQRELEKTKQKMKQKYKIAAIGYEAASAYLYNTYSRPNRYKKVISMVERVIYLFITTFIKTDWLVPTLSGGIMVIISLINFIGKPYTAKCENFLENVGRIVIVLSLGIGSLVRYVPMSNALKKYGCGFGLIALSLIFLVIFIVLVFYARRKKKTFVYQEEEIEQSEEIPESINNTFNSLKRKHMLVSVKEDIESGEISADIQEIVEGESVEEEGDLKTTKSLINMGVGDHHKRKGKNISIIENLANLDIDVLPQSDLNQISQEQSSQEMSFEHTDDDNDY